MAEDALNEPDDGYDEYVCAVAQAAFDALPPQRRADELNWQSDMMGYNDPPPRWIVLGGRVVEDGSAEAFRAIRDAGRSNRIIPIPRIMRARPRGRRRRSGARSRARSPGREPDEPHGQALPARGEVAA